jgi:hypothetical protein
MGWANPPRAKERHIVTVVLKGPVDDEKFRAYHRDVEQLEYKYKGKATPKLIRAPKARAKAPKRRAKKARRGRRS